MVTKTVYQEHLKLTSKILTSRTITNKRAVALKWLYLVEFDTSEPATCLRGVAAAAGSLDNFEGWNLTETCTVIQKKKKGKQNTSNDVLLLKILKI